MANKLRVNWVKVDEGDEGHPATYAADMGASMLLSLVTPGGVAVLAVQKVQQQGPLLIPRVEFKGGGGRG